MSGAPMVRSPAQAAHVFGQYTAPRQRHVFLVRFHVTPHGSGLDSRYTRGLTFEVKRCDRPKVVVKTEEMNQYNKKRQVNTGFKYEPVRITFWDSVDGAAQRLWDAYARYYFGDFSQQSGTGYHMYDVTTGQFYAGGGYGLTEGYGLNGRAGLNSDQWFFPRIDIIQLFSNYYDQYSLINPRITAYEPDELDYESASVAQINMQFAFENVQYTPNQKVTQGAFPEFTVGPFNNDSLPTDEIMPMSVNAASLSQPLSPTEASVGQLLATNMNNLPMAAPYRAFGGIMGGALSPFGQFSFGGGGPAFATLGAPINGAAYDVAACRVAQKLNSTFGPIEGVLSETMAVTAMGSAALNAASYAAFNAAQTGTAQIGYNAAYAPAGGFGGLPSGGPKPYVASPYSTAPDWQ